LGRAHLLNLIAPGRRESCHTETELQSRLSDLLFDHK
jgi:hypothetical protein